MGWNETDQEEYEITEADKKMFQDLYSKQVRFILISMPTGFFIWGHMYPLTFIFGGTSKFLGVQSLTLHLGVQRKLTAFSPRKVVHHAVFL